MINRQLELGFENRSGLRLTGRNRRRSSRANWWFERMRGVVNHARDWPPASPVAKTLRPPADRATSGGPQSAAARGARGSSVARTGANALTNSEPHRWKFRRPRRLIWEYPERGI